MLLHETKIKCWVVLLIIIAFQGCKSVKKTDSPKHKTRTTSSFNLAPPDLSGKHKARTASNLLNRENSKLIRPKVNGGHKWKHVSKGEVAGKKKSADNYVLWNEKSYDPGTGSFKLSVPKGKDQVIWDNISLEKGESYSFSLRCMAPEVCPSPVMLVQVACKQGKKYTSVLSKVFGPGDANKWEEFTFFFDTPLEGSGIFRIEVQNYLEPIKGRGGRVGYIDDLYLGKGKSFADPPSQKSPFNGEQVRIDGLGNIEVKEGGKWKPFFPFIIYPDGRRSLLKNKPGADDDGWKLYSKQGFNTVISGNSVEYVRLAEESGMKGIFNLGLYYASPKHKSYQNFQELEQRLNTLKNKRTLDNVLFYYIDNEVRGTWQPMKNVISYVTKWEKNNFNNRRQIPIYLLNGNPWMASKYNNAQCKVGDVTGTYMTKNGYPSDSFVLLDNHNNQKMPVSIAQINGSSRPMRTRLYGAIAHGAKGMGYWKDFAPNNPTNKPGSAKYIPSRDVTKTDWWGEFPDIVREVEALMPLIRQPHWTTWKVTCNDENIDIGTREYENGAYVIIANYSSKPTIAKFNVSGLPFSSCVIENYFSPGSQVTQMKNSSFNIQVPGYGVGVYKLKKNIKN